MDSTVMENVREVGPALTTILREGSVPWNQSVAATAVTAVSARNPGKEQAYRLSRWAQNAVLPQTLPRTITFSLPGRQASPWFEVGGHALVHLPAARMTA